MTAKSERQEAMERRKAEREKARELQRKYSDILSRFKLEERSPVKTILALAAKYDKQIDELDDFIPTLMPDFAAEVLLKFIEKYRDDIKDSYIPGNSEFYVNKYKQADKLDKCTYQLAVHLLEPEKDEPLATIYNVFLELADSNLQLLQRTEQSFRSACWKKSVFQPKAEITRYDHWNPSQHFSKFLDSLWMNLTIPEEFTDYVKQSEVYRWISEGTGKEELKAVWMYLAAYIKILSENGKAAVAVPIALLEDEEYYLERKFLLEQGCVEAVILLPKRLNLRSAYALMVLRAPRPSASQQSVYIYDAMTMEIKPFDDQPLTESGVQEILNAIHNEDYAHSLETIKENDYILTSRNKDCMILGDITAGEIARGAVISSSELNELTKFRPDEKKRHQLLRLQDIQDGIIDIQEPLFLSNVDNRRQQHLLDDEIKLLISKNKFSSKNEGNSEEKSISRYKTAVFDPSEIITEGKILVSNNIYILKIDQSKANPYYVQAYLESDEGQKQLDGFSVGTSLKMLGGSEIKAIAIPACDIDTQNSIGEEFRKNQQEIRKCRDNLRTLVEQSKQLFTQKYSK